MEMLVKLHCRSLEVVALVVMVLVGSKTVAQRNGSQSCPGNMQYRIQPPTQLNCNPVGNSLIFQCAIQQNNGYGNVTWYWTRCVDNAGVNGTAIQPEDKNDVYGVYPFHPPYGINATISYLIFLATNTTLGYYWCELNSASSRPSVIVPVLQPVNESLPECTILGVNALRNEVAECAIEGSPITIPRVPLPSFCPKTDDTSTPDPGTLTVISYLLAVFGALIVLLVLVIVVLSVCLCCKTIRTVAKEVPSLRMHDTEELI